LRKLLIGLAVSVFMLLGALSIYANPGKFGEHSNPQGFGGPNGGPVEHRDNHDNNEARNDSRYVLHRTADVINDTQQAAMRGHKNFGLARAIYTQQHARDLYMNGDFQNAIFFSLRARNLAFDIIRANHGMVRPEFFPDRLESKYDHQRPGDHDLDRQIDRDKGRMGRDDDAVRIKIEFNL
jgi:hypothetical protein